jgi:1-aminocyclopropane-1-carboxylate deaminase
MLELEKIIQTPTPLFQLTADWITQAGVFLWVKRDDLTHPDIMGNKWRKWQGHLAYMQEMGLHQFVTFGGAHSNHIWASAAVGKALGFSMKAFIRGDELTEQSSPTLRFASKAGMQLNFVSRTAYREKDVLVESLDASWYCVPEGGSGYRAWAGMQGVVQEVEDILQPDAYICALGTGGSAIGLAKHTSTPVIGVPVLKGMPWADLFLEANVSIQVWDGFQEGGYGKRTAEQRIWMQDFQHQFGFPLDSIYTSKAFRALEHHIRAGYFKPKSNLVFLHSGGLTGDYTG